MENCLKTQLKQVVNNDNLEKLGVLTLQVTPDSSSASTFNSRFIHIKTNAATTARVVGSGQIGTAFASLSSNPMTIPANEVTNLCVSNDEFKVEIDNKYCITEIYVHTIQIKSIITYSLEDLKFSPISKIGINGAVRGDIENIKNASTLSIRNSEVSGSINVFSGKALSILETALYLDNNPNLLGDIDSLAGYAETVIICSHSYYISGNAGNLPPTITRLEFSDTKVGGSSADLGKLYNLTYIYCSPSSITGSIEELVSTQISNRPSLTSGMQFVGLLHKLSFGGNIIYPSSANGVLTWESASKIAAYVGSTTKSSCTIVYCKGYGTQEQAEAELRTGNVTTVIRVDA